jgi:hypothetical protein
MKIKKRGQITYFIIAGIAILVIVGFVLYIRSTLVKQGTEEEIEKVKERAFSTAPVENYVSNCLKLTAENALELLGKQGGKIYTDQGGGIPLDRVNPLNEGTLFVWKCVDTNNAIVSCGGADQYVVPYILIYDGGFYRDNDFFGLRIADRADFENTFEHTIESYVAAQIDFPGQGCLFRDTNDYKSILKGFEIIPDATKKEVDVTITSKDIKIALTFPLKIQELATGKKEDIVEYKTSINIQLEKIRTFVREYLTSIQTGAISPTLPSGIQLSKEEDTQKGDLSTPTGDAFVRISDADSNVRGKPFEFWFGIGRPLQCVDYGARGRCRESRDGITTDPCKWSGDSCDLTCKSDWSDTPISQDFHRNDGTTDHIIKADNVCFPDCGSAFPGETECKQFGCKWSWLVGCNFDCKGGYADSTNRGRCTLDCTLPHWTHSRCISSTSPCKWTPGGPSPGCHSTCYTGYKNPSSGKTCAFDCGSSHWDNNARSGNCKSNGCYWTPTTNNCDPTSCDTGFKGDTPNPKLCDIECGTLVEADCIDGCTWTAGTCS